MSTAFQFDLRQLAVGILYLNLGSADLEFPTTSRSHPSYRVQVTRTPTSALRDDHERLFPFFVWWDVWRRVVAPLFEDGSVLVKVLDGTNESLRIQINRAMLAISLEDLLMKIEQALLRRYEAQGYLPLSILPTGSITDSLVYKTDTELAADAAQAAADALEQELWEASLETDPCTGPWWLQTSAVIPTPVFPDSTLPTVENAILCVPPPPIPGDPVELEGTGEPLAYQQFDC